QEPMTTPTSCCSFFFSALGRGRTAALALVLGCVAPLCAQRPGEKHFDLPAGDAAVTLPRFIVQAGEQLAYLVDNVRGVPTNPVAGDFSARAALDRMLAGTRLIASEDR